MKQKNGGVGSPARVVIHTSVKILSIGTDRCEQTVQTQIKLLLMEKSDQGLHCLLFHAHLFDLLRPITLPYAWLIGLYQFSDNCVRE